MTWVDVGAQTGRNVAENSVPVVVASDDVVQTDLTTNSLLSDIRQALLAIAGSKGLAADLRVTPTGTVTVAGNLTTVTTVTTCSTVGGITTAGSWQLAAAVPNWQNQTAVQSFVQNIARS